MHADYKPCLRSKWTVTGLIATVSFLIASVAVFADSAPPTAPAPAPSSPVKEEKGKPAPNPIPAQPAKEAPAPAAAKAKEAVPAKENKPSSNGVKDSDKDKAQKATKPEKKSDESKAKSDEATKHEAKAKSEKNHASKHEKIRLAMLTLKSSLPESAGQVGLFGEAQLDSRETIKRFEKAAKDKSVSGLVLDIQSPEIGRAKIEELRGAIAPFANRARRSTPRWIRPCQLIISSPVRATRS